MKPIWYFVGLVLMAMGVIVLIAGLVTPQGQTKLAELQPNIWWGCVMIVSGAVFYLINRKTRIE